VRDHRYAVVTCPRCLRSFIIVVRWRKWVRCTDCGATVKVNLSRRVVFREREDAVRWRRG